MNAQSRAAYWLALAVAVTATVAYVMQRDMLPRCEELRAGRAHLLAAERECDALERDVADTRQLVRDLENNPLALEAAARSRRGLVRPGEIVYRIDKAPAEAP